MRSTMKWLPVYLTLCFAACGDDGGGAAADAGDGVDAGDTSDAAPTSTACGVFHRGTGTERAGQLVSFNAPDGSLLGTDITDVDGRATYDACVTDTVITLYRSSVSTGTSGLPGSLYTVTGVQPGDTLVFGTAAQEDGTSQEAVVNVTAASDVSALVNASTFSVRVGGQNSATTPGETVTFDVVSEDLAGRDGEVRGIGLAFDDGDNIVGYSSGMATFVPDTTIEMTLGAWTSVTPPTNVSVDAGAMPAGFVEQSWNLDQLLSGVLYSSFDTPSSPTPFPSLAALPTPLFDTHVVQLTYTTADSSDPGPFPGFSQPASVVTTTAGLEPATEHTVDPQAFFLPRLHEPVAIHNSGRPVIQWFTDGDVSDADGATFYAVFGPEEGSPSARGSWAVVTHRPGDGMFTMPELPDALQSFAPRDTEEIDVRRGMIFDLDYTSYRELITSDADELITVAMGGPFSDPDLDRFLARVSLWSCQSAGPGTGGIIGLGLVMAMLLMLRRRRRSS